MPGKEIGRIGETSAQEEEYVQIGGECRTGVVHEFSIAFNRPVFLNRLFFRFTDRSQ